MVGLDGTGKSTTVHLASHVAGCILYRLTLTRGYGQADFRDDLKKVFKLAGVQGSNTVFLLTDSDIVKVCDIFLLLQKFNSLSLYFIGYFFTVFNIVTVFVLFLSILM